MDTSCFNIWSSEEHLNCFSAIYHRLALVAITKLLSEHFDGHRGQNQVSACALGLQLADAGYITRAAFPDLALRTKSTLNSGSFATLQPLFQRPQRAAAAAPSAELARDHADVCLGI
jgi:hypothetical protein